MLSVFCRDSLVRRVCAAIYCLIGKLYPRRFSPHQDLVSERLATLYEISASNCDVLIVPAAPLWCGWRPPLLSRLYFLFKQGETLNEAKLKSQLTLAGYSHVSQVMSPGEYSVRGGLIDLFQWVQCYRIVSTFGDTIESIRTFDADTQRSFVPSQKVRLLPGREFPMDEAGRAAFRQRWREQFEGRSITFYDLQGYRQRHRLRWYRILFAFILRTNGDAVRVPAE